MEGSERAHGEDLVDDGRGAIDDACGPAPRPSAASTMDRSQRAVLWVLAGFTLAVAPVAMTQLGPQTAFLPMVICCVLLLDTISAFLLINRFADTGDLRSLFTGVAYLWSSVIVVGYALSFPGLVSDTPPLGTWPSATPWLYLAWHVGFPALLAVAWATPSRLDRQVAPARRRRTATTAILGAIVGGFGVIVFVVALGRDLLPVVIQGRDTTRMTTIGGPPGMAIAILAAVVTTRGLRHRRGPERWVSTAAWVCVADLALTFGSLHRYSVGWYAGRTLTVVCVSLVFVAMIGEFTALQRRLLSERRRLWQQARTDPLTGLANRRALTEALTAATTSGSSGELILLDLDRFKAVNDAYGHDAGDEVIAEVGRRMNALAGPGDVIARLGGDELAVLRPGNPSARSTTATAAALSAAVAEPIDISTSRGPLQVQMTASLGITEIGDHPGPADVLRAADVALYRAKAGGRGRAAHFDDALRTSDARRRQLEQVARQALRDDRFVAHLQPTIELRTGVTLGHELLLRLDDHDEAWRPEELLEVVKESELITEIDTRVVLAAAQLLCDDPDGELGHVAVNVSPRTIARPDFLVLIDLAHLVAGPAIRRLVVEVNESILIHDDAAVAEALAALRAVDVRVGLDDFGTGHSALARLRSNHFDFLKIDGSLIADIGRSAPVSDLVALFIGLAEALGMTAIAEGIETTEQLRWLQAHGCPAGQGFHLGAPGPISVFLPGHATVQLGHPVAPPADHRAVPVAI